MLVVPAYDQKMQMDTGLDSGLYENGGRKNCVFKTGQYCECRGLILVAPQVARLHLWTQLLPRSPLSNSQ